MKQIKITRDNFEEQVEFFKGTIFNPIKDNYNNLIYEVINKYEGRLPWYNDVVIKTNENEIIIVDNHVFNYLDYYFKNEVDLHNQIVKSINNEIDLLNDLRVTNDINLGDVVSLKSGSMLMVVKEIADKVILCEYYLDGEFKTATFNKYQLKIER